MKDEGVSILLAEQNLNFARNIYDRAYLIYQGSICHESTIEGLSEAAYEKYCALQPVVISRENSPAASQTAFNNSG